MTTFRDRWANGDATLGAWLSLPSVLAAETTARVGFDYVCADLQHGALDYADSVGLFQAVVIGGSTPIVRVPWNEPGVVGKVLDAGAEAVIAPMVNTQAEAAALVRFARYPPLGARSFGPVVAGIRAGNYHAVANDTVAVVPMIETVEAVSNLDDILSVPGVDAIYVGPADLSLSLGLPPGNNDDAASFTEALRDDRGRVSSPRRRARHPLVGRADAAPLGAGLPDDHGHRRCRCDADRSGGRARRRSPRPRRRRHQRRPLLTAGAALGSGGARRRQRRSDDPSSGGHVAVGALGRRGRRVAGGSGGVGGAARRGSLAPSRGRRCRDGVGRGRRRCLVVVDSVASLGTCSARSTGWWGWSPSCDCCSTISPTPCWRWTQRGGSRAPTRSRGT